MATNVQVDPLVVTPSSVSSVSSVEQLYLNQKNGSLDLEDLGKTVDDKDIIELANILAKDHSIKYLFIRNARFSMEAWRTLAAVIKRSTTVQQLDLVNSNLGPEYAETIADLLRYNKSLFFVNLSYNPFGLEGGLTILDSLESNTTLGGIHLCPREPWLALKLYGRLITILQQNRSLRVAEVFSGGVICFRGPIIDSPKPYLERNKILYEIKKAFPNTPLRLLSKEAEHKEKKETAESHLQPDVKEESEVSKYHAFIEQIRTFARQYHQYSKRSATIKSLYAELKFAYFNRLQSFTRSAPLLLSLESLSLRDPTSFVGILEGESPPLYKLVHHQNQQGKF